MDKENVAYTFSVYALNMAYTFCLRKEGNPVICYDMDEP